MTWQTYRSTKWHEKMWKSTHKLSKNKMTAWKQTLALLLLKCKKKKKKDLKNKYFSIKMTFRLLSIYWKEEVSTKTSFIYIWYCCVKSVRIRSYSSPHFFTFELNTERYGVSHLTQIECGKMRTRITPNTGISYTVTARNLPLSFWLKLTCTSKSSKGLPLKVVNCENTFVFVKDTLKAYSWQRNTLFYTTTLSRLFYLFESYTCVLLIDLLMDIF